MGPGHKGSTGGTINQSFTLLHVLLSEQKSLIQVGKVDGVEIEQGNVTESGKYDVLDCKEPDMLVVRKTTWYENRMCVRSSQPRYRPPL